MPKMSRTEQAIYTNWTKCLKTCIDDTNFGCYVRWV